MNSNQISSSSETSIKEEVKSIPYERFENYRVQIDGENWFEVDGMLFISKVRIVNIRSVHGHIDGKDFDFSIMNDEMHFYLKNKTNVELINILSRQYNHDNWFDVYSQVQDTVLDGAYRKEILSSCEPETIVSGLYKQNLLLQDGHLKPNEVYSTSHFLRKDTKYEAFPCIPIYHINGSRFTNARYVEHLVHFDILIHLLMKKFISFKSKILHLAGIEVQVAQGRGKSIQEYMNMKNSELVQIIMKQQELNKSRDKQLKKTKHKVSRLERKMDELIKINKEQTNQLHEANTRLQDVQGRVIDMQGHLNGHLDRLDQNARFINEHFTSNNTTFMAINECLTIFPSQDLMDNWPNELGENEIIYDVFAGNSDRKYQHNSMFKPNRAYHISEEEFNEGLNNHMIRCANGKDLLRYVRSNMPTRLGTFLPDSKLITSNLNDVKTYVQGCVEILLQRNKQTVVHSLDEIRNAITRDFEERFGQLRHEVHDDMRELIEPIHDEINEIVNVQEQNHNEELQAIHEDVQEMNRNIEELREELHRLTTRDMLLQTYPNIQTENLEGYINKRYRTFRIDNEGRIWFQPYVGAQDIELSLDELQTIILRDRNGRRYRNGHVL